MLCAAMSRRRTSPLKPLLNQIRAWAQQGRTDAWIGHQLDVSPAAIAEFRSEQGIVRARPDAAELGRHDAPSPVSLDTVTDLLDAELAAGPAADAPAEPKRTRQQPSRQRHGQRP